MNVKPARPWKGTASPHITYHTTCKKYTAVQNVPLLSGHPNKFLLYAGRNIRRHIARRASPLALWGTTMAFGSGNGSSPLPILAEYAVRYFDQDWNELEELSFTGAGPLSVELAVREWLVERELIRSGTPIIGEHYYSEHISVEVIRGKT